MPERAGLSGRCHGTVHLRLLQFSHWRWASPPMPRFLPSVHGVVPQSQWREQSCSFAKMAAIDPYPDLIHGAWPCLRRRRRPPPAGVPPPAFHGVSRAERPSQHSRKSSRVSAANPCHPSRILSRMSAANPCQARNSPPFGESSCLARICPCAIPRRVPPFSFPSLPPAGTPTGSKFAAFWRIFVPGSNLPLREIPTRSPPGNAGDLVAGRPVQPVARPPALPTAGQNDPLFYQPLRSFYLHAKAKIGEKRQVPPIPRFCV